MKDTNEFRLNSNISLEEGHDINTRAPFCRETCSLMILCLSQAPYVFKLELTFIFFAVSLPMMNSLAISVANFQCNAWFNSRMKMLEDDGINPEYGRKLALHWRRSLDDGAKRTLYHYMSDFDKVAFHYVAYRYCYWLYDETSGQWDVTNPSAALVWILRWTYWNDPEFWRVVPH